MAMQPTRQRMSLEQYLLLVNNSDRRLSVPAAVEQVEEENEREAD
jgi:hypothetical protein